MRYNRYTLDDLKKSSDRKRFSYISFFAGGGGSSAGYKLAGGDARFVNEFQQVAVNTYLENWPGTPHICGDIKNVTGQQIMEMTGLKVGELDILDGSPPCPPFSMSGTKKKGWNKEKMAYGMKQKNIEDLTWEMIRIAGEMMPKVIICENVKGLTMEYAKQHLDRMVTDFEGLGYTTTYKVLNGIHFGVPQKRQRVFIVSVRNDVMDDIGMPWMTIQNIFPDGAMDEEPTIEQAIGDLRLDNENSVEAHELRESMKKSAKYKWLKRLPKNPEKVASVGDDVVGPFYDKLIAHRKKWGKSIPERKSSFYQSRRVPWHQASHTLSEQGLQTSLAVHLHASEDRVYTTKESKRIMTLPEDYKLTGTLNERLARIGLMVAPMCMKYVAESIYEKVLEPYNELHNSKD
jgi:DNA (cytosine-5)-methyltransferase 1|tara:strand:+ start:27 stop:1235 length:1209 start_codon:yes stop_codon:yes gene_type:complete